ncbi:50S ribosomal protein L39e [Candidatus Micrarchaeota archaeon]|nr:50S ribosomal protein L39e [Candidatus Micrarchaeota archaeon]
MSSRKSSHVKKQLVKASAINRRVPVFVMAKTRRRVTSNPNIRHWRRQKLKLRK